MSVSEIAKRFATARWDTIQTHMIKLVELLQISLAHHSQIAPDFSISLVKKLIRILDYVP